VISQQFRPETDFCSAEDIGSAAGWCELLIFFVQQLWRHGRLNKFEDLNVSDL